MDTFAHAFWSYAIFLWTGSPWLAVLFGIMPDLLSFGSLIFVNVLTGNFKFGKPNSNLIPKWVYKSYDYTHSLVVSAVVIIFVFLLTSTSKPWFLLAWPLHIAIDIPSHKKSFFPTPFLWPVSDFSIDGISWGTLSFTIINYFLLVILYIILFITKTI